MMQVQYRGTFMSPADAIRLRNAEVNGTDPKTIETIVRKLEVGYEPEEVEELVALDEEPKKEVKKSPCDGPKEQKTYLMGLLKEAGVALPKGAPCMMKLIKACQDNNITFTLQ